MKEVREGLFIGGMDDELPHPSGSASGISHILSVAAFKNFLSNDKALCTFTAFRLRQSLRESLLESVNDPNPPKLPSAAVAPADQAAARAKLVRKTVALIDTDGQNLLDHLEGCLEFIENGRREGSVLVHCVAGISRSAAVITAYLMRSENLSFQSALSSLKERSKTACPNPGFKRQLQMFEAMGAKVDKSSSIYKRFHLEDLGNTFNRGERIDVSNFAVDPSALPQIPATTTADAASDKPSLFRCKKCRRLLAVRENVLSHKLGAQEKPYKWKKGDENHAPDQPAAGSCASLFVEPMQWMTSIEMRVLEGKLLCNGCKAKVGSFNWAGVQCSCGTWINPAFQLHQSKVDASWT